MINTLATIMLICMGVAHTSVAPIYTSKQEQKQPIITEPKKTTTNYTLNIECRPTTGSYNTSNVSMQWKAYKQQSNIALNVNLTTYMYSSAINDKFQCLTYNYATSINDAWSIRYTTKILYVYEITPYNYNTETEITITNDAWDIDDNSLYYSGQDFILQKWTYETTEQVHEYVNQQLATDNIEQILSDLTDINNGYYYNSNYDEKEISSSGTTADTNSVNIQPNIINYFIVCYNLVLTAPTGNNSQFADIETISGNPSTSPPPIETIRTTITGINIIPDGNYEVVDIPGMMFQIVGMPFAFVSTAFNLTIFPGTPYQINISNLILAILAVLLFTWLITKVVKR